MAMPLLLMHLSGVQKRTIGLLATCLQWKELQTPKLKKSSPTSGLYKKQMEYSKFLTLSTHDVVICLGSIFLLRSRQDGSFDTLSISLSYKKRLYNGEGSISLLNIKSSAESFP